MKKKFVAIFIAMMIVCLSAVNVFAGKPGGSGDAKGTPNAAAAENKNNTTGSAVTAKTFEEVLGEVIKDGDASDGGPSIVVLTSPEVGTNSTYDSILFVSGNTEYNDVVVCIAKYDKDSGIYVPIQNTDGESRWEVGDFRLFTKKIELAEGANKVKIVSYRTSQIKNASADNIQVNCFSVDLLKESIIDRIKDLGKGIGNSINELIKSK